ncbi:hypothetical protein CC86DRAFT_118934 [Ophiobolus disseminans]|uniref:Rhodopsin domain-containing protein n=1 Tax=Ophiobolus disseminans TaxID=1469910 RepID=A0A6A6ZGL7_9PLEO|nr:hypothetical protein CC86DRAFT_118934 [Ophiobolus disseminans]
MCKPTEVRSNALITAQNHGPILVMVAWFLACLLALCTAVRIISRCRSQRLHHLPLSDDIVVVSASLCGIGATVIISTAIDSGLGKRQCLLNSVDMDQIQMKVFISTILFVLALSISKCSILVFLHQLADNTLQRVGVTIIGIVVLIWTLAVMAGIVFECEMPRPWEIWTGKCIPMLPFWITATTVDIVIDATLIILSAHMVWTLRLDYHQKTLATVVLSLRLFLIAASSIRLVFLEQALSHTDPTFTYIPYAITTQCHSTLSVILACTLALRPLTNLLDPGISQHSLKHRRHSKHWSGTTIGGTPYESYDSFALNSKSHIIREPLHTIQRSMSAPTSPATSRNSLNEDILLPEVVLPSRYTKAPPRPPPPRDEERPDLSMFTQTTIIREPPMVTRVGSVRSKVARGKSLKERGLA